MFNGLVSALEASGAGGGGRELKSLKSDNEQLRGDLKDAKSKNSVLKQKITLLEEKNVDLASKLYSVERELEQSRSNVGTTSSSAELMHYRGQVAELRDQLERMEAKDRETQEELNELLVVL